MAQNEEKVRYKYFSADFRSFWYSLRRSLPKSFQKEALFIIYIKTSSGVNNFRNTWPMILIFFFFFLFFLFFFRILEIPCRYQNCKKMIANFFGFLDNLIWIRNRKFSVLLREHSYFPVNVLSSIPKISDLIENNFF